MAHGNHVATNCMPFRSTSWIPRKQPRKLGFLKCLASYKKKGSKSVCGSLLEGSWGGKREKGVAVKGK